MTAYLDAMRRYASFSGRSTRSQFWLYTLTLFVILIVAQIIDIAILGLDPDDYLLLTGITSLAHLLPSVAIFVRRLHDIDRTGWWVLIGFIPLIGTLVLIVFACLPSTPGSNRFGSHPMKSETASRSASSAAASMSGGDSGVDQLQKLASLRDSGAIDDADYQRMKARIVGDQNARA